MLTSAVKQYRQAKAEIAACLAVIDVSLNDTLKLLMRRRDLKETEEMVKKFKVPERR